MKIFEHESDPDSLKEVFSKFHEAIREVARLNQKDITIRREALFQFDATVSCLIREAFRAGQDYHDNIPAENRNVGDYFVRFENQYNDPNIKKDILDFSKGRTIGETLEHILINHPQAIIRFRHSGRDDVPLCLSVSLGA